MRPSFRSRASSSRCDIDGCTFEAENLRNLRRHLESKHGVDLLAREVAEKEKQEAARQRLRGWQVQHEAARERLKGWQVQQPQPSAPPPPSPEVPPLAPVAPPPTPPPPPALTDDVFSDDSDDDFGITCRVCYHSIFSEGIPAILRCTTCAEAMYVVRERAKREQIICLGLPTAVHYCR
jgi:hypothetical protein